MPASEAQIRANQANAARSCGPKTEEGKAQSRRNAFKHGLTGDGVVLPEEDAAEVDRLTHALRDELDSPDAVAEMLIRRIAMFSVRMDRSFNQETAALSRQVRQVLDEFVAPEGVDAETAAKLRVEAGTIALFDSSKEASLARKYEATNQRGFFQAIKDLRQLKAKATGSQSSESAARVVAQTNNSIAQLGSFLPAQDKAKATVPTPPPAPSNPPINPSRVSSTGWDPFATDHFDVPFAIGKRH
jgi:hypothetical protein